MFEGGCECGRVRYRWLDRPIIVNCCHCRQCQKLTGSAFAINAMIEAAQVEVTSGADDLTVERGQARCRHCATLLWASHRMFGDAIRFVRAGTLDEGERLTPDAHFFVRSKLPWITLPEGVPQFETLPGEGDPPLLSDEGMKRLEAARGG
jgi:hypothetical protein